MKLTERTVKAAKVPVKGRAHLWDEDLRGFGLRIYPSGSRSFVFRYTAPGGRRRRLMVLGEWGVLTVHQARVKAKRFRGRVLEGEDPGAERDAVNSGPTVMEFADIYIRRMKKRWTEKTRYEYERRIEKHIRPALGSRPLERMTRAEISDLLESIADGSGPYESNRVHELIRAMFNRAQLWGFFPEDRPNPARAIERFRETSRDRWLKPGEVEALMEKVRGQLDPFFQAFVPLLLLTGLRKNELLRARWDHLDFERGEILLPSTKSGRPQVRKLSAPAVEILRFLPRQDGNPHVFPGRTNGSHRKGFKNEWDDVRENSGLEDVTLHDLRRTAGSYMAQAGAPLQVIGEILGHQSSAITKVYARLAEENEQQALEALGEKLVGLFRSKEGGAR